jgi:NAD(P)-dependent dehydrogenase (short-subunit alcohol dehydrogenase family)
VLDERRGTGETVASEDPPVTPTCTAPIGSTSEHRDLTGMVALITGAGRGIGRRVAVRLAERGAAVGLVARSADELEATRDLIALAGGTAASARADVTDAGGFEAAFAALRRRLGPTDVLINNAGVLGPIGPLWENDLAEWWTTMDVNVRGTVLGARLVLPDMIAAGRGRIINITSQAGVHRWPLVSGYSVSKAAVVKLTENLALETARHGVAVFSVHPGLLPIGMGETMATHEPASAHEAHVRAWTLTEIADGHGAEPERAIDLLERLAAGDGDRLSGRHLSVHDDLDCVLRHLEEVRAQDLYVLRPERLRPAV